MATTNTTLTIRQLTDSDDADVARLAELDSSSGLRAPLLGAEVEGRLLAAVSVETGEVLADPFSRTAELRDMLELRALQLRKRSPKVKRGLRHRHAPAGPHSTGALAGSPPGAGGRLISLYSSPAS